jgi:hypothetical protein
LPEIALALREIAAMSLQGGPLTGGTNFRISAAAINTDEVFGTHNYSHDDIAWQHRYVDIMTVTADGRLFIDYARFHEVTPDGVGANAGDCGDGRPDASPENLAEPI